MLVPVPAGTVRLKTENAPESPPVLFESNFRFRFCAIPSPLIFVARKGETMAEPSNKRQKRKEITWSHLPDSDVAVIVKVGDIAFVKDHVDQQPPVLHEYPESLLENLLFPLPAKDFLAKYFRQCAVHVPSIQRTGNDGEVDDEKRMACLTEHLADLNVPDLFRETASDNIFVWLQTAAGLIQSIEVSDPDTAIALFQAGNATYCRAPAQTEQLLVSALLENTGLGCGQYDETGESMTCLGRGEVEVFLSARPGHVTAWHYDFQENFTLQISGTKRWTMQKGTVKHPVRGCTPHYASPGTVEPQLKAARLANPNFEFGHPETDVNAVGPVESVLLQPGDVFYFPAGMWHKIEVVEPGISINVSLMATNYATVTCQAIQHLLLQRDEWREAVVRSPDKGVVDHLKQLLTDLPDIIRDFERNSSGAECIIPPVLRHGNVQLKDDSDASVGEEEDCQGITYDEDDIIDFMKFAPPGSDFVGRKVCVKVNPLASMLSEKEITKYYSQGNSDDPANQEGDETFVLNVNYAGNEAHESNVRVRFKDHSGTIRQLVDDSKKPFPIPIGGGHHATSMAHCLVYYGYLTWCDDGEK